MLATLLLTSSTFISHSAETTSVIQAKTQLQQLNTQINKLKETLATAQDKRGLLNQEMSVTEKEIGFGIKKMRSIQRDMDEAQKKISSLQQRVVDLNKQLTTQQQLLSKHIRIRYKMGEYQPLKWVLNQEKPYSISQLLTFHQYLVRSRQKVIDEIDTTRQNLTASQENLLTEVAEQKNLQEKLHDNQQKLEQDKHYHTVVIQSLNNEIQSKEHTLSEFEKNKANLSRLLKTLAEQSIAIAKQPFIQMRHKLPKPVHVDTQALQKMNQGVTFFATEGSAVNAVYPGKVVFSDWLNGYGLLLIIDHGQGFMTLYAHNQSLFKPKGSQVMQGEQIAAVGHTGGIKQNGLYFEVRQRGKAVPPLDWLS